LEFETIYGVPETTPLLHAENLAAERGGRALFSNINLTLGAGELRYLRGPNGSGKTTLLRTLAGLSEPEEGTIHRHERVSYWGHTAAVKDELSAQENLEMLCTRENVPTAQIADALARVGLGARKHVLARRLSAGQRRRIGMAWLKLAGEKVWLLDEPTAALDSEGLALLAQLLATHAGQGGAALIATHVDVPNLQTTREPLTL
jgi:heme exporter protein A